MHAEYEENNSGRTPWKQSSGYQQSMMGRICGMGSFKRMSGRVKNDESVMNEDDELTYMQRDESEKEQWSSHDEAEEMIPKTM